MIIPRQRENRVFKKLKQNKKVKINITLGTKIIIIIIIINNFSRCYVTWPCSFPTKFEPCLSFQNIALSTVRQKDERESVMGDTGNVWGSRRAPVRCRHTAHSSSRPVITVCLSPRRRHRGTFLSFFYRLGLLTWQVVCRLRHGKTRHCQTKTWRITVFSSTAIFFFFSLSSFLNDRKDAGLSREGVAPWGKVLVVRRLYTLLSYLLNHTHHC